MKIITRLYLGAALSLLLAIILVSVVFSTSQQLEALDRTHEQVDEVRTGISELNFVMYEYLMHHETRMEHQWVLKYDSTLEYFEQSEDFFESIVDDYILLGSLFSQVTSNYLEQQRLLDEGASQEQIEPYYLLEEGLVTQLLITSQSIITDVTRISDNVSQVAMEFEVRGKTLILSLMTVLSVTVASTSFLVARSISGPLKSLVDSTELVSEGKLDHRVEIESNDELGELAGSFNHMTSELMNRDRELREYSEILEKNVEEKTRLNRIISAVSRVNHLMVSEKNRDNLLQGTCYILDQAGGYNHFWIAFRNESGEIDRIYQSGLDESLDSLTTSVAETGLPFCSQFNDGNKTVKIIRDLTDECNDCPLVTDCGEHSSFVGRLLHNSDDFGVMVASVYKEFVTEREVELFTEVLEDISFALHRIDLEEKKETAEWTVRERVKELTCLYSLDRLSLIPGLGVNEFLSRAVSLLPPGYQFPEITVARITYLGEEYRTENFAESEWGQKADFVIDNSTGSVEVYYLNTEFEVGEDPFLVEEKQMLDSFADYIGQVISAVQTNQSLVDSENKHRSILDSSIDAVFVTVGTEIKFANNEAASLLGFNSAAELVGRDAVDFIHPDYQDLVSERARQRQSGAEVSSMYDAVMLTKDGERREVEFHLSLIEWDGEQASLSFTRDITEKNNYNRSLSALHEHALRLSLADTIHDVAATSLNIINEIIGCEYSTFVVREDDILRPILAIGRPVLDVSIAINGRGISAKATRENRTIYAKDVREDPDYIKSSMESLSELAVPIAIGGRVVAVIILEGMTVDYFKMREVSLAEILSQHISSTFERIENEGERELLYQQVIEERIKTEQEQELGRLKNQFISTATHELRTPVTSILGYLELVLSDTNIDISEEVREDLNVVLRNANRLVTLTNDLLDVQRISSGRFEVQLGRVDIVQTLGEVVEELSPMFAEKQQVVQVKAPAEMIVDADEIRISQLFINLLRNSNKFTPDEGNVTISIEPDEGHVLIKVKDTGIGLSEDDIEKLFEPFPGISHGLAVSSTGLGLAICKGIVEVHNGDIWAESGGPGEGSTFSVRIPLESNSK
mgnify:CR=1 FL=1